MKFIKTFILILFVALIALGGYAFYDYQNVLKKEAPIQTISFNQQEISFQSATVQDSILFGLYPNSITLFCKLSAQCKQLVDKLFRPL